MSQTVVGYRERALLFGRHQALSGILTHPVGEHPPRIPVLILGAGIIHKVGPSRISVQLARTLAEAGHTALRFDLSGIGDSPRAPEPGLREAVTADISDATTTLLESVPGWEGGVCVVGFCSGADNALFSARSDDRMVALALFDPTIHETKGFRRRLLLSRLTVRSLLNVASGRSAWLRARDLVSDAVERPPGYYGLLVTSPEEADATARELSQRGVSILFVIGGGARGYCNAPEQVAESMPTGFDPDRFSVAWCPEFDHLLSGAGQRRQFIDTVLAWLEGTRNRSNESPRS